ncbi:MAG: tetratricopeptide repeat protein, partial [Acidobacteria bacterium]|nr:tetratricopeptide repeat protein [Acidobacteriota bacterium]
MSTAATKLARNPEAPERLFSSPHNRKVLLSLSLLLLTLVVYNPVTGNGFVGFDDPAYVTANPHVRSVLSWTTVKWAFTTTEHANWHPLTWLSHALDFELFRLNPDGHHFVNVLLHAACALIFFLLLERMTGMLWRSAMVAALFALHPMNVQSVAWIAERKNVLSTLLFALAVLQYRWYVESPKIGRYLAVAALFILGLMAKPIVITLPFVLLILDYWPLGRVEPSGKGYGRLVIEKLPLFALSLASAVVTVVVQKAGGAIHTQYPFSVRLENAVLSYWAYLGKAVWPSRLAVFYPYPHDLPPVWLVVVSAGLLALTSALVLRLRQKPYLAAGWFWYLGTLVPVIGLVQAGDQVRADRYGYIPLTGIFISAVWALADWARARHLPAWFLAVAATFIIVTFSIVDRAQIGYWHDNFSLWSHALAVTDNNSMAHDSLGAELINEGRVGEAIEHFKAAAAIDPRDPFSELDLGVCEKRLGNFPAAIKHYQAALELSKESSLRATAFSNLGSIYRTQKDYPAARENYASALRLEPDNIFALIGMGVLEEK